jgi:hypothetical protein
MPAPEPRGRWATVEAFAGGLTFTQSKVVFLQIENWKRAIESIG